MIFEIRFLQEGPVLNISPLSTVLENIVSLGSWKLTPDLYVLVFFNM